MEELRPLHCSEAADHGRHRVADVDAAADPKLVQDGQQVVRVSLEPELLGGVGGGTGAHQVVKNHPVIALQQPGYNVLPHRLVASEPMAQHHHGLIIAAAAAPQNGDVVSGQH